jgi:hypothetical protein
MTTNASAIQQNRESFGAWLSEQRRLRTVEGAALAAHHIWVQHYPAWQSAFFDKHFLEWRVIPRLQQNPYALSATHLAELWADQFAADHVPDSAEMQELQRAAIDYLYLYSTELAYQEGKGAGILSRVRQLLTPSAQRREAQPC